MINKRKQERFKRRYKTEFLSKNITYKGVSNNFSLNGLYLRTHYPPPPDSIIDILVHLPDGSTSKLKGKVKRALKNSKGNNIENPVEIGMAIEIIEKDKNYIHFIGELFG